MQDVADIIQNIESIYDSNTSFQVLKDFERVLDELDIYVYANWKDGELAEGPVIERHWVTCSFMWDRDQMPDPMGGKRLLDYDCKVSYEKSHLIVARKIEEPDDIRPGTKKGKLDRKPTWIIKIQMPKKLIADIYTGYIEDAYIDPTNSPTPTPDAQPAEDAAAAAEPEVAV
mgnify:CR=1|jgi:hypothetical protein|tara:strand:+ start:283 stop:798 length:516 start_codon:yes stop_codon:yes gene_type:complete